MYAKIGLVTALIILIVDLTTKWYVATIVMNPPRVIDVFPFFNLVLGYNRGVSFGIFGSANPLTPYILSALSLAIVVALLVWLWRSKHAGEAVAIGAIIGGAAANITDRIKDGAVTDFLDFYIRAYHWPAFNLADTGIVAGASILVFRSYYLTKHS